MAPAAAPHYATSIEAEEAFYGAFRRGSLADMMAVWDDSPDITCIHPLADRLTGRDAVGASWRAILRQPLDFTLAERSVTELGDLAVHVLHEIITDPATGRPAAPMVATNIYRRVPAGWRMILHHASPARAAAAPAQAPAGTVH